MKWTAILLLVLLCACQGRQSSPQTTNREEPRYFNAAVDAGKTLFMQKCASCHKVNAEMSGPALHGVQQRWPDANKLAAFIRNSQAFTQTDPYAKQLWLKYNQTVMPPQPALTDAEITQILAYIKAVEIQ